MKENTTNQEEPRLSCEVCLKEIPESTAYTQEGEEYIRYFCGIDCYQKWHREKSADKPGERDSAAPPRDENLRE